MVMRDIPLGVQDFKKLRDLDLYFVDKSQMVASILDSPGTEVFLFTRPRRFGKSLNLSMLDAYLNGRYSGNHWFDGLSIDRTRPDDPDRNTNTVVCLDMKGLGVGTYDDFLKQMSSRMSVLYREFMYLEDSDRLDSKSRQEFMGIYMENGDADLGASLFMLLRMLYAYHGRKVVLLIDEYDSSVNDARTEDDRRRILDFMKQFLGGALKGNEALRFAVVTGVLQIAKESIFSGLNNLVVNNVFSRESDEMFGFTASEVQAICEDYGHPEKYPEAKEWYDGYRFGNAEIYNPWSVLSYVKLGFVPGTYWAGTSGNSIVPDLVDRADRETRESLRILAEGGSIRWPVEPMVTFADLGVDGGAIWSVMVMSGYLRAEAEETGHAISIPNKEMFGVFAKAVTAQLGGKADSYVRAFADAVLSGDAGRMQRELYGIMAESVSVRLLRYEIPYQTLILGLLMHLAGRYRITGDFESGRGYHDIRLESRFGDGPNIVMEIKVRRTSSAEAQARKALEQIREKDYMHGLKGETILYGICFDKKVPVIESERISGSRTITGVRGPARP